MKRALLSFIIIVAFGMGTTHAQSPDMFNYQAVARNSQGEVIANQSVGVKISILQGSTNGSVVYSEEHSVTTNDNGLVSMKVGNGSSLSGSFSNIDWSSGPYYIQVGLDETGGTSYTTMGTTQLVSVPYAKYADSTGSTFSGKYGDLTNTPELGKYVDTSMTKMWDKDSTDDFSGKYGDLMNKPDLSDTASYDDYWKDKKDTIYTGMSMVGIGTDSVSGNLTVQGTGQDGGDLEVRDDTSYLDVNATKGNSGITLSHEGASEGSVWYDKGNEELVFQNYNSSLINPIPTPFKKKKSVLDNKDMIIDDNDNVGINTEDPKERLDVNGAVRVQDTTSNPEPNRVYGNSMPLAYGEIDESGNLQDGSYGIELVRSPQLSNFFEYEITLQNEFKNSPAVIITTHDDDGDASAAEYSIEDSRTIHVTITGNENNTTTTSTFSIVVYGRAKTQ
jgi:hypothetical protein